MSPETDRSYLYDSHPVLASSLLGAVTGGAFGLLTWWAGFHWILTVAMGLGAGLLTGVWWYLEMRGTGEPYAGNPRWLDRLILMSILVYASTLVVSSSGYRAASSVAIVAVSAVSVVHTVYDLHRRHSRSSRSRRFDDPSDPATSRLSRSGER